MHKLVARSGWISVPVRRFSEYANAFPGMLLEAILASVVC